MNNGSREIESSFRLTLCLLECEEAVLDRVPGASTSVEETSYRTEMESVVSSIGYDRHPCKVVVSLHVAETGLLHPLCSPILTAHGSYTT